ncbi:oligopeptide transporter protein [Drechmeria coniospora]|uniref:Oligopeptide transporter protein n=1 Tax=Drechmeria coniospora TaxID=98403 RepID=A0A151GU24_DRECN|nr:oligopeptide transporter protein [Drechmeria coniospora]KYK60626.1 oligopeptide transporter protein [Drechmeria coniospora]
MNRIPSSEDDSICGDDAPQKRVNKKEATEAAVVELVEKLGDGDDGVAPLDDVEYVMDKIETLSVEECKVIIEEMLRFHEFDYNFSGQQREKLKALLEGPLEGQSTAAWELEIKTETAVNKFFSPYPEVRAISTPTDDVNIPCETIRAHLLGYLWAMIAQFTNSLFNSRFPQITLSSAVAQILLFPCGKFLAWALPDWGFNFRGKRLSLNPGPWSYKEQMLSTIIIDVGLTSAYCFSNIQTQTVYYKDRWLTPGYGILLLLSTQLMGLGFSGLLRRFVVYPVEALWPSTLPTLALNRALLLPERRETVHGWSMSRYRFFLIVFAVMFVYFWLPGFLFPALSLFAWMTWIAPNNFTLNAVTGSQMGLGFNPISTLDWNVLSTYAQPLAYPFFAFIQQFIGTIIGGLIIIALYFSNVSWTAYLPPNSSGIFDNTGAAYNISRVVRPDSGVLDEEAYKAYSPAFYGAGNLVVYGAFFAFYPLTMVFIVLDTWRPLLRAYRSIVGAAVSSIGKLVAGLRKAISSGVRGHVRKAGGHLRGILRNDSSIYDGFDDPFTKLMRSYPEVPDSWFFAIAVVAFIFALVIVTNWPQLGTPVWALFFVVGLNLVFLVPMTYLYAISGTTEGLNVVTELIVGYALPGHPEAMMFVKAFGYNINGQADNYISDQKMGFYAKLPPRAMYRGQVMSAILTALVAYGVVEFADTQIPGICTPDQVSKFNCANGSQVFFAASVVWGAIGPQRIFSQIYPSIKYCFLLGFLLAIVWWTVKRFGNHFREACRSILPSAVFRPVDLAIFTPVSWLKHVHPSLIMNGVLLWAPTNLTYFTGGLYFSFIFMYYLKRHKTAWWEKYNYVLSAALTGSVAFSGIIIFFAVQYHPQAVNWWGSNVLSATIDGGAGQTALITELPAKGYFGIDSWF